MISGLHVQYFFVCKRKLWLYAKNIRFEEENERVLDGKLLHDKAYSYADQKELIVDEQFKIDVLDGEYVREVKLSRKMTEADRYQLLFYLYQLKKRGLERKGLISYTKEKRTEEIVLTEKDEKKLEKIEKEINKIIQRESVPALIKKPYCKSCAYYDFCFADELEEDS
ncbi:MAG: CRISPR-associated protein Cas4 [Caldibacillus sp.]